MPVLATVDASSRVASDEASDAARPLALVEAELAALCRRLGDPPAGADAPSVPGPALQHTLQQLQVHLFLTASQLLPVWRDLCRDTRVIDQVEVRLDQLRALTDQTLDAGADDVKRQARCAVLAEGLQRHRVRSVVLLRALDAVVKPDGLRALADVWVQESARLLCAQRQGDPLAMDNEDADPVGRPAR